MSDKHASAKRTRPTSRLFVIGALVLAFAGLAIAAVQIFRNNQDIKTTEITKSGIVITFYEHKQTSTDGKTETVKTKKYGINVPDQGFVDIADSDLVDMKSKISNFQRFGPFIFKVLSERKTGHKYSIGDGDGLLVAWLNPGDEPSCYQLMTLYTFSQGGHRLGSREACPRDSEAWVLKVPADIGRIFNEDAGPDFKVYPFLFEDETKATNCLKDIEPRISAMALDQIAARCLVVGPEPGDAWITNLQMLKINAELPYADHVAYEWYQAGHYKEALRLFAVLALFQDRCWTYQMLGATVQQLGDKQLATQAFSKAVSLCPDDFISRIDRAKIYSGQGLDVPAQQDVDYLLRNASKLDAETLKNTRDLASKLKSPPLPHRP